MKTYIFVTLLSILCLVSCVTAYCPGYDLNDYLSISFRKGDTITYVSNQFDTINFVVNEFYYNKPYEYKAYPLVDYECDYKANYKTNTENDINIKERLSSYKRIIVLNLVIIIGWLDISSNFIGFYFSLKLIKYPILKPISQPLP